MEQPTLDTIRQVWITTLVIYLVVVGVVAMLLTLILLEARKIRDGVSAIWNVGQRVANNTIHIALLRTTNQIARQILDSAGGVVRATAAVQEHARTCPGCPACVIGPEWKR